MSNKNRTNYSPSNHAQHLIEQATLFDDDIAEDVESAFTEISPLVFTLSRFSRQERLDKALAQVLTQYSRNKIQAWITQGRVCVNGHITTTIRQSVLGGEQIELNPTLTDEMAAFVPEPIALDVVYADAHIIVLNKPVGLVVHPAAGNWSGTLLNGLLYHYPELAKLPRAGIVHRLDKDTSGLLVIARTLEAQTDLVRQLQARTVKRHYLAMVFGETAAQGTIDAPIGRDSRSRIKMAITQQGKLARTHFYRLATTCFEKLKISLLRCELETGRTHQIRVHLASLKHPLLGDMLYGRKLPLPIPFARQALHAYALGLRHPVQRIEMRWQVDMPTDMVVLAEQLGLPIAIPSI